MKKDTIRWGVVLGILLVLYLLLAFLIPVAHTATFWVSIIFTLIAFCVVAASIYIAFIKDPDAKSRFYGFPIARIGVIYGLVQLIASLIFIALSRWAPVWAAFLVYAVALGAAAIGLIGSEAVVSEIQTQDTKLKAAVSVMRSVRSKVDTLCAQCPEPVAKQVRALAEELRYSDPVSSEALAGVEQDLVAAVDQLQAAIVDGDITAAEELCRRAAGILAERDRLCKLNK